MKIQIKLGKYKKVNKLYEKRRSMINLTQKLFIKKNKKYKQNSFEV